MKRMIIKLFGREYNNLNQTVLLLAGFTFLSQILALFRDRLLAGRIGAGETLDIYYAAFKIPDLLFVCGAMLVSVSILIPFLNEYRNQGRELHFVNQVRAFFSVFIMSGAAIFFLTMPWLVEYLFAGFPAGSHDLLVTTSRIMLLSPIFLGISNIAGAVTQSYKRFFVYAIAPVIYNASIIFGIVFLFPIFGVFGLAYGVVAGAVLHAAVQLPVLIKHGLLDFSFDGIDWALIRKIFMHSFPRAFTLGLSTISFLVFTSIASYMAEGSVSVISLARNLNNVPLALIGASFSVAAFPTLVNFFQKNQFRELIGNILTPMRQIIFWSLPVIVGIIILRAHIVRLVLGSGEFGWDETRLVAAMLAIFIISSAAQSIILLLTRGFYAIGRTATPFLLAVLGASSGLILAVSGVVMFRESPQIANIITQILRISDIVGSEVVMLAVGYSLGVILHAVLLFAIFEKSFIKLHLQKEPRQLWGSIWKSTAASIMLGIGVYTTLLWSAPFLPLETFIQVLVQTILATLVGGIFWIITLVGLRSAEMMQIIHKIFRLQ